MRIAPWLAVVSCFAVACASAAPEDAAASEAALVVGSPDAAPDAGDWQPSGPHPVGVTYGVHYGPVAKEKLDVCQPTDVAGPVPAFIVIHGGGWYKGDKDQPLTWRVCETMASYGYVAFNVDYRLVQNEATTFPNPAAVNTFPIPLVDVQLAVRWVRFHAAQYDVDPGHVCSWGDSAGAHLATFLGVLGTIYPGDEAGLFPRQSPAVNCVIDNSGPVDFRAALPGGPPNDDGYLPLKQLVNSDQPSDLENASPLLRVSPESAPMIVTQGTADTKVLPFQATELVNALQANGVDAQLITYVGGHVFKGLPKSQEHDILVRTINWAANHAAPTP